MTPEQTLDWLAQQHFDQCREERPIQEWIRKMKSQLPEQPKQNTVEEVKAVLKGIDKTEIESPDGWWETSTGAEFGAKKLKYVIGLLAQPEQEPYAWEFAGTIFHDREEVFGWYERGDISEIPPLALYTTPQQRTWVELTKEDMDWLHANTPCIEGNYGYRFIKAIEAKLKEKNT